MIASVYAADRLSSYREEKNAQIDFFFPLVFLAFGLLCVHESPAPAAMLVLCERCSIAQRNQQLQLELEPPERWLQASRAPL